MMKVAVIGCGNIANSAHIPAYMKNSDVEIAYFCDILPDLSLIHISMRRAIIRLKSEKSV